MEPFFNLCRRSIRQWRPRIPGINVGSAPGLDFFHAVPFLSRRNHLSSLVYKEQGSEKEFICAMPDSSGMHKCDNLPLFRVGTKECSSSIETGLVNETDCINWNMYYEDCRPGDVNPFHGAISFDNIGLAWVAIFLVSLHSSLFLSCMRYLILLLRAAAAAVSRAQVVAAKLSSPPLGLFHFFSFADSGCCAAAAFIQFSTVYGDLPPPPPLPDGKATHTLVQCALLMYHVAPVASGVLHVAAAGGNQPLPPLVLRQEVESRMRSRRSALNYLVFFHRRCGMGELLRRQRRRRLVVPSSVEWGRKKKKAK